MASEEGTEVVEVAAAAAVEVEAAVEVAEARVDVTEVDSDAVDLEGWPAGSDEGFRAGDALSVDR